MHTSGCHLRLAHWKPCPGLQAGGTAGACAAVGPEGARCGLWLAVAWALAHIRLRCSQQPCLWVYLGFRLGARHGLCQTATNAWQTYMAGASSGGLQPAPAALAPSWVITHWGTACALGQPHGSPSTPLDPGCHHPPFVLRLCMQSVPALIAAARGTAARVGLGVGWPHPHQPLYGA